MIMLFNFMIKIAQDLISAPIVTLSVLKRKGLCNFIFATEPILLIDDISDIFFLR